MILLSGPNIAGNEWKYVKECLDTAWVSSVGAYVTQFEEMLAQYTGRKYGVATSSGTTALHISLLLAGVERDDYVIVPNITFVASLNSIKYTGANPILIDADAESWQMDLNLLERFLNEDTEMVDGQCRLKKDGKVIRAIMPVHVLGNIGDMDKLMALADQHGITIVEDSTEALGSYYKGKSAGTFSEMGCFSFNGNKIITCGGGGMIVTDNEELAQKAKHITTQAKADKFEYYHDQIGYNYRLTNVAAAIGVGQMEQLPAFIKRKHEIKEFYCSELNGVGDIEFQKVEADVNPNWWLFTIKTDRQEELLKALNANRMQSRPFWVPMNQLPMFKDDLYITDQDVANQVYKKCLSIPCSTYIKDEELEAITDTIKKCYKEVLAS
ncbi:MAG: LegC family aminotransferase [Bacteroidota bacterium]